MNSIEISNQLLRLNERRKALETLVRYETDAMKLRFYERELEELCSEIRCGEHDLRPASGQKVLPFIVKPPNRLR
ncbi:MAG TPA: hypothetical protein VFQ00_13975 [Terriglobales bacterium]|nr:hypothetical protein [Terriglobales bacterium]